MMRTIILPAFFLLLLLNCQPATAQNVTLNILTKNGGQVTAGGTLALEITVNNMSSTEVVPAYKLRPRISVPAIVSIAEAGHDLPEGWTITSNSGSEISLSNANDKIPVNSRRTILIMLTAKKQGGPSTISGQMLFSNGVAPGLTPGAATAGDNASDNISTTSCQVNR